MTTVKNYLSLVKFSHTIFAMPFALIGFFLGLKLPIIEYGFSEKYNNTIVDYFPTQHPNL